ncbi:unnamed protein product [Caenorhabditis brenneri]
MIWVNDNCYFIFYTYSFFETFFYNAQSISVIIISTHRLWSSVSVSGNEFWKRNYRFIYGGVVTISAVLAIFNCALKLNNLDYYDHGKQQFVRRKANPSTAELANHVLLAKSVFFFSTLLVINIWTIYYVCKRFSHDFANENTKTMMKNLTTIAFINSFLFFVITLWPIGLVSPQNFKDFYYYSLITSDTLSLSLPYILLAFDKNVQSVLSKLKMRLSGRIGIGANEIAINYRLSVIT